MIAPVTSLPLMTADTTELLVATTTDPLLRFVKNVVVVAGFGGDSADFRFSVNRGTNCNSQPKHNMI